MSTSCSNNLLPFLMNAVFLFTFLVAQQVVMPPILFIKLGIHIKF
ncbi:hypothetical protein OIU79_023465 [Salix purpurea]|uniref:Uncharacterized protein n=1 Tax=Salix purpurea TaxID=77065 RepID=A0A9Q0WBJ7_SALPP|nr:hypothetical protein OIU79_023465 [Salix purpurea]